MWQPVPLRRTLHVAMSDVTLILQQIEAGDAQAAEQLLPLVYDELRKLAAARMAAESPNHTLQATALVHEAYLRLVGDGKPQQWQGRAHFFGAAAEAMRRILVDHARRKQALKRAGHVEQVAVDVALIAAVSPDVDLIALNEALDLLAAHDGRKAELVKLRYFGGLTLREAAGVLGISESTADADWAYAKSWLRMRMDA